MVNLLSYYHDDEHVLSSWLYLKNYGKNMSEWLNLLKLIFGLSWLNDQITRLPWWFYTITCPNNRLEIMCFGYKNFHDNKHVLSSWLYLKINSTALSECMKVLISFSDSLNYWHPNNWIFELSSSRLNKHMSYQV